MDDPLRCEPALTGEAHSLKAEAPRTAAPRLLARAPPSVPLHPLPALFPHHDPVVVLQAAPGQLPAPRVGQGARCAGEPEFRKPDRDQRLGPVSAHQRRPRPPVLQHPDAFRRRRAAEVHDLRVGRDHRAVAERRRAQAHVRLFAIHEVAAVETAELPPQRRRQHEETALDDVDVAHAVASPPADPLRVEEIRMLEDDGQAGEVAKEAPRSHLVPGRRRIQRSVRKNRPAAGDAGLRMLFREREQIIDRVRVHLGVGIEQQDPFAVDPLDGLVVGAREAEIPFVADQVDLREPLGDHAGRSVLGAVVRHDHPHVQIRRVLEQGFQTAQRLLWVD